MIFSKKLMNWYDTNSRDLPWRKTKEPYKIWLSEIILQQTRIDQGTPYYTKFVEEFPTVFDLAKSKEEDIYKLWQGLGYYSRAKNLHFTAKHVVKNYNGVFPKSYNELKSFKGIGDYTASAIVSICFDLPEAVVDGNVFRFLGRYFGIKASINSTKGYNLFKNKANKLIKGHSPGNFNQAMMDFGSIYCKPKSPNCPKCIFSKKCKALKTQKVEYYPVKTIKIKIKTRYFNYLVIHNTKNQTVLEQRNSNDIWHKLYQFPLVESSQQLKTPSIKFYEKISKYSNESPLKINSIFKKPVTHMLSHQKLIIEFWKVELSDKSILPIDEKNIFLYPVPSVIEKFMTQFYKTLI